MGCCLTTTAVTATDANKTPPVSVEETVKEVLAVSDIIPNKLTLNQYKNHITNNPVNENASEVSSEIYTYSAASHSTVTTIGTGAEADEVNKVKMVSRRPPVTSSRRKERGVTGGTRRELTSPTVTAAPVRRLRSPPVKGEAKVKDNVSGKRVPVEVEVRGNVKVNKVNDLGVMPKLEMETETEICDLLDNPRVSLECFIFL